MAIRFIFGCFLFIIMSFAVVPVIYGVNGERAGRVEASIIVPSLDPIEDQTGAGLTFQEIYAMTNSYAQDDVAAVLNDITPGAGGEIDVLALEQLMAEENQPKGFSKGFTDYTHPAL